MRFGRHPAYDHLNDYWNALERNAPPDEVHRLGEKLDPARKAALDQARSLYQRERPDPAFLARLETDLMNAFATTPAGTVPLPRQHPGPSNGRIEPRMPTWLPALPEAGRRRKWAIAQLATAALLIVTLLGAYYYVFNDRNDQPAVLVQPATPEATPGGAWTTFKGDAAHRGEANAGPTGQPIELWRFQASGACEASPVVLGGVVYAACSDGFLHALDAGNGDELWRFDAGSPLVTATVTDDHVYVTNGQGSLIAIDLDGRQEVWRFEPSGATGAGVVVDGLLATGTYDGSLLGIDVASGTELWRYQVTDQGGVGNPAIADGIVYAGSDAGGIVAVDAETGDLLWRGDTGAAPTGTAVVADGIAYIGAAATPGEVAHLYAFDAETGEQLWVRDEQIFSPAVSDGVGYSGSNEGIVYAFDTATGEERWRAQYGGVVRPLAVAGDVVYVPSDGDQTIYALDAGTGAELWSFKLDGGIVQSVAVSNGVMYASTPAGSVYAIGGTDESVIPAPVHEASPEATAVLTLADPPVEPVWTTAGGPVSFQTFYVAVAPDGTVWANDIGQGRFQIFDADGNYLETWTPDSPPSSGEAAMFVAFDGSGNLYVLDQYQVRKFDADRNLVTTWGSQGTGDGQFQNAIGIGIDGAGNVYICGDNRVQKFDSEGTFLGKWGSQGRGDGQFFGGAGFMDVDPAGNSYVADNGGNKVLKFDSDGNFLLSFGEGVLTRPNDVAIDSQGNIYVGESPGGVEIFDASGNHLGGWTSLEADAGSFASADGVALDGTGGIYVADNLGSQVLKFRLLPPLGPEA